MLRSVLEGPTLWSIRRNHGLEHATIHLLSERHPRTPIAGRADTQGYYIYGQLPSGSVEECAREAAQRLRQGQRHLAIHPNCGTSFLTSALMAGATSYAVLLGGTTSRWRDRLGRMPLAVMATVISLILAQPLGAAAQKHITTTGEIGDLEVVEVKLRRSGRTTVHRVNTRG